MKKITIEVTEEQHKKIVDMITPKTAKLWRAERGGEYFYKNISGEVFYTKEDALEIDDHSYLTGNYFQTREEAEASVERDKAIGRVTHRIIELNDGWEPDWVDRSDKWLVYCDHDDECFDAIPHLRCEYATAIPYIATKKIAEQIIDEMEHDLKIIWWG